MAQLKNREFFVDIFCSTHNGLSQFLGAARVALIITDLRSNGTVAFDPSSLLGQFNIGHNRLSTAKTNQVNAETEGYPDKLLVYRRIFASMIISWFVEKSDTLRNENPIKQWLHEATTFAAMGLSDNPVTRELRKSARDTLLSFSSSAVKRSVQNNTKRYRIINPIDVVLHLTLAYEEGRKCSGNIVFYDGEAIAPCSLDIVLDDGNRPSLTATKHLRKLMTSVESSDLWVVACSTEVTGIIGDISKNENVLRLGEKFVASEFARGRADIISDAEYLCSAYEGQLFSRSAAPSELAIRKLLQNGGMLGAPEISLLTELLSRLTKYVQSSSSGCSLVLDASRTGTRLAGEYLKTPLDLKSEQGMQIASRMAKIDGALHLEPSGQLLAFGCLLDGGRYLCEDRARGARYNSAIRFTHENPSSFIVTVSSDGPLSCFFRGKELTKVIPTILSHVELIALH